MMKYPLSIERAIRVLSRLPGVGKRTAERYVFDLILRWKKSHIEELQGALQALTRELAFCPICHCIMEGSSCFICNDPQRQHSIVCVVSSPRQVFAIENTKAFHGLYHVLNGLLSPLDGIGEQEIGIEGLKQRLNRENIQEVVIALDSTLEGDTTALYLYEELKSFSVQVFRLAFGIPVGSSLEYVDGGSLARAFTGRSLLSS